MACALAGLRVERGVRLLKALAIDPNLEIMTRMEAVKALASDSRASLEGTVGKRLEARPAGTSFVPN
jgi:hypothetical protein